MLQFYNRDFLPLANGGLWWPDERKLLVADLHLEKGSFFASHGQMLPPYDSIETLNQLAHSIDLHKPAEVLCLGDSFHDPRAFDRLHPETRLQLRRLTRETEWTWITGNHDPAIADDLGGKSVVEKIIVGIMLRHEATARETLPEISGHYHPKLRLTIRGRSVARRCFAMSPTKLVLPSFGAYTGGLDVGDPVMALAIGTPITAIVASTSRIRQFPVA
jgi:uncharacterized protein